MKKWWSRLSLTRKLQFPIQLILLVVMLFAQRMALQEFEQHVLEDAGHRAEISADGVLNGLNMLMLDGSISNADHRAMFVKKMGMSDHILELRVIRDQSVNRQYGPGLSSEQPVDELDRLALKNARLQSEFLQSNGHHAMRIVVPVVAHANIRGTNCLACHAVPEGAVSGAISVTIDVSDDYAVIRKANYVFWFVQLIFQVLLYFVIGMVIRRAINPARQLQDDLEKMSMGDFTGHITVINEDEIGSIAKSAIHVNDELGKLIGNLKYAATHLAETAQQVSMVSNMTSEGVKAQKDETLQASQAVKQIADSLLESVEGSQKAVSVAVTIRNQAGNVKDVVTQAIDTINALAVEVKAATEVIQTLEKESNDINAFTKTIAQISNQTNLLALNAAIEAARAGEQGRGFAVVADEVRKLAQRTHDATQEIQQKIAALHSGVSNATEVMTKGRIQADESVLQINKTSDSLDSIVRSISMIHEVNEKIANSATEQSRIASKINDTILNISHVAEQTAYSSSNTTIEIEKVRVAAQDLDMLVAKFIVPDGENKGAAVKTSSAADDYLF